MKDFLPLIVNIIIMTGVETWSTLELGLVYFTIKPGKIILDYWGISKIDVELLHMFMFSQSVCILLLWAIGPYILYVKAELEFMCCLS